MLRGEYSPTLYFQHSLRPFASAPLDAYNQLTSITDQKFKEPNWPHLSQCWMQMEFLLSGEVQLFSHPHLQSALKPDQPAPVWQLLRHLMRLTAGKRRAN